MSYEINITAHIPKPLETVFADFSDHGKFGTIVGANIVRIRDSHTTYVNGIGSVRRISSFAVPSFEETITVFKPNHRIEYTVSKGSPVKNHLGQIEFRKEEEGTTVLYHISFEPRTAIPGWGVMLRRLIRHPIVAGIKRYSHSV
ncbi:SRPBCC family protein [Aestuariibacter salexigens]|uniref:SRPBCC family protein n=1 Tax=Aestuariibacter salexigens TaxID=226010 RepID=UPI00040D597D|nr:SRPBCC family protein [Aestuariibacter salexigens]